MPILSNNSVSSGIAESTLALTALGDAVRQINESTALIIEPIRQVYEAIEHTIMPIRIIQDSINTYFVPTIKTVSAFSEIVERHQKMMESLTVFGFNGITRQASLGIFPEWLRDPQIVDAEITDEKKLSQRTLTQQVITIPQLQALVPVTTKAFRNQTRARMGLKQISGGNFSYRRVTLKGLSLRNREGQLLKLMLENQDLFVSDEIIKNNFYTQDIIEESQIVKLLKNKFKQNGLKAVIKRQGDGYILISIEYLQ